MAEAPDPDPHNSDAEISRAAALLALSNLRRNRTEIQPRQLEREDHLMHSSFERGTFGAVARAAFLWLETLGPALGLPREGHCVRVYVKVDEYILTIQDRRNNDLVAKTLEDAQQLLVGDDGELGPSLLQALTSHFHREHKLGRLTEKEMRYKVKYWQLLELPGPDGGVDSVQWCELVVAQLKMWQSVWDSHAGMPAMFRRIKFCRDLVNCLEIQQIGVNVFNWSEENEVEWLQMEAKRLLDLHSCQQKRRSERGTILFPPKQ